MNEDEELNKQIYNYFLYDKNKFNEEIQKKFDAAFGERGENLDNKIRKFMEKLAEQETTPENK